jgi:hypothetical protein
MGILSLLVKLGIDSTDFEMGVKRAQSVGEKFGNSFKSAVTSRLAGALSVAAVTGFAHSVVQAADNVGELAEQLNMSTDDIQKFQMAAKLYGVKFESVATAITRINDARTSALSGNQAQLAAFQKLGISVTDLTDASLGSEQVLARIGIVLNANRNNAELMAAAADLLGLKLTKAAMAAGMVKDLGPIDLFKAEDIKQIEKFNDEMDILIKQMQVTSVPLLSYSARVMSELNKQVAEMSQALGGGGFAKTFATTAGILMSPAFAVAEFLGINTPAATKPAQARTAEDRFVPPQMLLAAMKGERFGLGGAQDSLARIGGFTGFQTGQDIAIKQAVEQTLQLKQIAKSTAQTAQVVSRE